MRTIAATLIVITLILAAAGSTSASSFCGLGDLPGGDFSSAAAGVSANGSVVIGYSDAGSQPGGGWGPGGFRWTSDTGMVPLGSLGSLPYHSGPFPEGLSADGSALVGDRVTTRWLGDEFGYELVFEAIRWTSNGGMLGLGDLPGGSFNSAALGVSADGFVVVGGGRSAAGPEAFIWTSNGGMAGLGDLPGGRFESLARAVSADGSVVVGGGHSESGPEAFIWTSNGGMAGLGDLPGGSFESLARAVSADGSVVVGGGHSGLGPEAFIWSSEEGIQSLADVLTKTYGLNLNGWSLEEAAGISADGRIIVGTGINPDGKREAWMADTRQVPIPSAVWLFGSGLVGLVGLWKRLNG